MKIHLLNKIDMLVSKIAFQAYDLGKFKSRTTAYVRPLRRVKISMTDVLLQENNI